MFVVIRPQIFQTVFKQSPDQKSTFSKQKRMFLFKMFIDLDKSYIYISPETLKHSRDNIFIRKQRRHKLIRIIHYYRNLE